MMYVGFKFEGVCASSAKVDAFEDVQVREEVTGAQATFGMGADGPDAPQGPGKGVAHFVMALH